MRIVIVGAGTAGRYLAAKLVELRHEVVLVDSREEALEIASAQADVLTVHGEGASPSVLDRAELAKADMLLAVTNRDEVNIMACVYANALGVPRKVARVSDPGFSRGQGRLDLRRLGVDLVMCHKEETARDMFSALRHPGAVEVVDLLDGRLLAVGLEIKESSPLAKTPVRKLSEHPLLGSMRLLAVQRKGQAFVPHGVTRLEPGDMTYLAVLPDAVEQVVSWACPDQARFEKVVIAGGGDLGLRLAELLEGVPLKVTLMEPNEERAQQCSETLGRAVVMRADALLEENLENAGVNSGTAFVAVTGDDEGNIISCLLAKKRGAVFTMAKVAKTEYVPVIESLRLLDRVISPQQPMVNSILHFVRGRHVKAATLLHRLPGELLEVALGGGSPWAGRAVKDLDIPRSAMIAGVLRGEHVQIATGSVSLQAGDVLVIFALPRAVPKLRAVTAE